MSRFWILDFGFWISDSAFGADARTPFTLAGQSKIQNPKSKIRSGFTLVELLVAMTLLAVISGGMALSFSTSLRAAASIQQRAGVMDERRKVVDQLRADLQGVWLRSGSQTTWFRGGSLSNDPNIMASATSPGEAVQAQGDWLELTTARPISLDALQAGPQGEGAFGPQSDVAQVSWRLEQDTEGALALVRRERTPPDPTVDETQDPSVVRTVMSRSVTGMQVYGYDGTQWVEMWDAALPLAEISPTAASEQTTTGSGGGGANSPAGLPQAVQVTLTFARGAAANTPVTANQPSPQDLPLTVVVAMPGAEEQVLQQETQQTTGVGG